MVFQLQDSNKTFSGKDWDWDANKGFLKNLADKIYIAPDEKQIALIDKYTQAVSKGGKAKEAFLSTLDDKDPLKTYFTTLDGGIATQKGITAALNKTTLASKAAAVGMNILNAAMNMGVMLVVSWGVTELIKLLDKSIVTIEEQKEVVKKNRAEFEAFSSELESINDQLAKTDARINELNAKDTLSLVEKEELARLKETNRELNIQLALKEKETEITAKKLANESENLFNRTFKEHDFSRNAINDYKSQTPNIDTNNVPAQIAAYEELIELRDEALKNNDTDSALYYSDAIGDVEENLLNLAQLLQETRNNLSVLEDPSESQLAVLDKAAAGLDLINSLIMPEKWKSIQFDEIINADDLKPTKDALVDLAQAGKLSERDIEKYPVLVKRISEIGISAQDAATQFNELYGASEDVAQSFTGFNSQQLSKSITDAQESVSALSAAYKEQFENQKISADTMSKLMLEHENWVDLINVENGVIQLNGELAIETARQKIQAKIEEVDANLKGAQENRNNASVEIQLLKKKVAAYKLATQAALTYAQAVGIGAMMGESVNQIANLERNIAEMDVEIAQSETTVEALRTAFDRLDSSDPFSNLANSANNLADAQKALEDSLRSEGEAAIRVIDKRIKAVQDEQKASEDAIDSRIKKIREEKEVFEKAIDAELKKLNERKDALEDSIKNHESAAGAVNDLIDEQIDAIDKRKDEVDKFYDEQIDALEKVNKELQDQIEREKALEELEKAKNQKVLIYRKDKGFGYETDDGAVKEAQDNLDQVLSDQAFQAEKDRLENERQEKLNALDAEKTLWEEYQKLWEDSTTTYEREQQKLIALEILGKDWEKAILDQRTDILDTFREEHYNQTKELQKNVLTQIDALNKQKDEESAIFEERIAALEAQKEREAENYAGRIEQLNGYKESVQERLNLIGKTWEEYQIQLDYEAKWEAALFDGMATEIENYADRVEDAMRRAQAAKAKSGGSSSSSSGSSGNSSSNSSVDKKAIQDELRFTNKQIQLSEPGSSERKEMEAHAQDLKNKLQGLSTGGIVTEPGWFITDEDGKKEPKVRVNGGKATLLDKGDIVFPHGLLPDGMGLSQIVLKAISEHELIRPSLSSMMNPMSFMTNSYMDSHNTSQATDIHIDKIEMHTDDADQFIDGLMSIKNDALQRKNRF